MARLGLIAVGAALLDVYLGTSPAILVPLHSVTDFSDNPWPR